MKSAQHDHLALITTAKRFPAEAEAPNSIIKRRWVAVVVAVRDEDPKQGAQLTAHYILLRL